MTELEQLLADLRAAAHNPLLRGQGSRLHAYLAVLDTASPDTLRALIAVIVEGSQHGPEFARTMAGRIG